MKGDLILNTVADKRFDTIAAGYRHTVGLTSDGTVVAVGDHTYGQCDVYGWRGIQNSR
ncbi:RCC1 domain-containing protein [Brevibacillus panacihumi]|nr:RCC1 domain-containing protein [Brevibacillus panacihumi]